MFKKVSWHLILITLTILTFAVYRISSSGQTPYDYFTRLATSFLQGKYYLVDNPSWLNELVKIGENKFAVVYPPTPAVITMPFVKLFGNKFSQDMLSQIMGAVAVFIMSEIAYLKSKNKNVSLFIFLLTGLGNIFWYLASNGSSWYIGQVCAFLFLSLAIYESISKKRILLIALFFGLAFLSRLQVILALPFIIYLNFDEFKNLKKLISFLLSILFYLIVFGIYNYLRFGSYIETGYKLIPNVLNEPWYADGIFSLKYIPNNLRVMFFSLPVFINKFPYIMPSWGGLSILITSPVFIYSLLKRKGINLFAWISILLIAFVIFVHGGTGFTQFGYRYAVDFYPILIYLIIENINKSQLKWHHWLLLFLSILVNTWGVILIKLGLVGW